MLFKFSKTRSKRIAIAPKESPQNAFATLFSQSLSECGYSVYDHTLSIKALLNNSAIIFHWPDIFFSYRSKREFASACVKLSFLIGSKYIFGTKLFWVAHNIVPHEVFFNFPWMQHKFLSMLDGVVYLSHSSKTIIEQHYPILSGKPALVTLHGDYTASMATRPQPRGAVHQPVRMVYFGVLRPYKNIEALIQAVLDAGADIELTVVGKIIDVSLEKRITAMVQGAERRVRLDLRDGPVSDAELEQILDNHDAVALPYRTILNSGSAIHALSCNKPILAPHIGSLPELQSQVGDDWVYLYEGDLRGDVITRFTQWIQDCPARGTAPLDAFRWERIAPQIAHFVDPDYRNGD